MIAPLARGAVQQPSSDRRYVIGGEDRLMSHEDRIARLNICRYMGDLFNATAIVRSSRIPSAVMPSVMILPRNNQGATAASIFASRPYNRTAISVTPVRFNLAAALRLNRKIADVDDTGDVGALLSKS
jgi:hypothetical protein